MEINKQTSTEVYHIYNLLLLLSVSQFYGLFVFSICVMFYSVLLCFCGGGVQYLLLLFLCLFLISFSSVAVFLTSCVFDAVLSFYAFYIFLKKTFGLNFGCSPSRRHNINSKDVKKEKEKKKLKPTRWLEKKCNYWTFIWKQMSPNKQVTWTVRNCCYNWIVSR